MSVRRFAWRGFGLELEVPDALGRRVAALARRVGPGSRRPGPGSDPAPGPGGRAPVAPPQVEAPSSAVRPVRRDPQRALDFLRARALAGDGRAPSPELEAFMARERERQETATSLADRVAARTWYHTIELPGGIVTPGAHDHRGLPEQIGLPADLHGLRALDVATFDGFWAFELERRGASVVAVDVASVASLDWPCGVGAIVAAEGLDAPFGQSFAVAHEALGSTVERVPCSVYDLDPAALGTFDLVFFGDLLLHLERPLEALRRIRSVASGRLVMVDRFDAELTRLARAHGTLLRYEGGWQGLEWWAPSLPALVQLVTDAGFDDARVTGTYRLPTAFDDDPGWHRAVIHATCGAAAGPVPGRAVSRAEPPGG